MKPSAPKSGLKLIITDTYEALSVQAADLICAELARCPELLLCVSAGGTPTGAYEQLVDCYHRQPGRFQGLRILQIDEWSGLLAHSRATCLADLRKKLLGPLHIPRERCQVFHSNATGPQRECDRIARWLAVHGPIDLTILGLGTNGHVAMNEPGEAIVPYPHVAKLAGSSSHHPMLKALRRKPTYGLTLGLGDILRSRKLLLLVSGRHKRPILKKLLRGRVSTQLPASFLWLHADATVLCDRAAVGSELLRRGSSSERLR
jgi:galactosamine-6-phosphate isomerase